MAQVNCAKKTMLIANNERIVNMKNYTRIIAALLFCAFLGTSALGCNTFRGAGKDVERGGQGIQNAADNVQGK